MSRHLLLSALFLAALVSGFESPAFAAQPSCSLQTVQGTYSFLYDGTAVLAEGPPTPVRIVNLGIATINGDETSGYGTISRGGEAFGMQFVGGEVEVDDDCTATVTAYLQPEGAPGPVPTPYVEVWTILDGGDRIRALTTEFPFGQIAGSGLWERISRVPGPVVAP